LVNYPLREAFPDRPSEYHHIANPHQSLLP
jgi:hypothetical protein